MRFFIYIEGPQAAMYRCEGNPIHLQNVTFSSSCIFSPNPLPPEEKTVHSSIISVLRQINLCQLKIPNDYLNTGVAAIGCYVDYE